MLAQLSEVNGAVLVLHNLAGHPVEPALRLDRGGALTDLLRDGRTTVPEDGRVTVSLEPYGCRWLRLEN